MHFAILPFLAAALFMGCLGGQAPDAKAAQQETAFSFPAVPVAYSAAYVVNEGGVEATKRVWASGNSMRIELADGSGGFFSLYFLGNRTYSCGESGQNASCFDVSGRASVKPEDVLPCQHLNGAKQAESIDIGGGQGECHLLPYGVFSKRKICCTDRGVLAYDEYNLTSGKTHTEYLADISYSASDSDFLLPAEPRAAPKEE